MSGQGWHTFTLSTQDSKSFSEGSLKSVIHAILAAQGDEDERRVIVLPNPPGAEDWQEYTDPVVKGRLFVMAKRVDTGNNEEFVIGIGRVGRLATKDWLNAMGSVSRIVLRDRQSGQHLFHLDRHYNANKNINFDNSGNTFPINIGNVEWQLNILAGMNRQSSILQKAPWLMMAFGMTLTLIGSDVCTQ